MEPPSPGVKEAIYLKAQSSVATCHWTFFLALVLLRHHPDRRPRGPEIKMELVREKM